MYGPRRRKAVSPFQQFEFLVFLVPLAFFLLAFVVLAMTIMPATPHHPSASTRLRSAASSLSRLRLSSTSSPSPFVQCGHPMHGVSTALWPLYCVGAGDWLCVHSRELLDSANVNDDYCDCADGSDEPGTSACAGRERDSVRFACTTAHLNTTVPLSRVNDGLCDCCDGSDEWRHGHCKNTCPPSTAAALPSSNVTTAAAAG